MVIQEFGGTINSSPSKKKQPGCLQNLRYYFTEYCQSTSIHGIQFLGERKRFIIEKIWWLIFVSVSLSLCLYLILKTYQKWMTAPVLVSFATSATPVWKIPFPAVTICPMIKSVKSKFDFSEFRKWKENHTETDEEDAKKFMYMSLVCPSTLQKFHDENATNTVDEGVFNFLMQVAPFFDNSTHLCKWIGEDCTYEVDRYFAPTLTREGICYSLNMLDRSEIFTSAADMDYFANFSKVRQPSSEWNLQDGYSPEAQFETYPRRTALSGPNGGLDLVFYTNASDIDYSCGDSVQGYKVLLHTPAQVPRSKQRFFWVPLDQEVAVAVRPRLMVTSKDLEHYLPKERKCYYTHERPLKFFKIYNQPNCLLECWTNYTYQKCHCVSFHMPREKFTPICGPAMETCMSEVAMEILTKEAMFEINQSKKQKKSKLKRGQRVQNDCDCLPACNALNYDVETSQMEWNWRRGNIGTEYDNKTTHMSRMKIFFKNMQFMASERGELFGLTDFWANCGGLLGLFTGFSLISMIEILYFLTLRLVCNFKLFGRRYWSGASELLENH